MLKNFTTTMLLIAVIATLTTALFESTKNVNAKTYNTIGKNIIRLSKTKTNRPYHWKNINKNNGRKPAVIELRVINVKTKRIK